MFESSIVAIFTQLNFKLSFKTTPQANCSAAIVAVNFE